MKNLTAAAALAAALTGPVLAQGTLELRPGAPGASAASVQASPAPVPSDAAPAHVNTQTPGPTEAATFAASPSKTTPQALPASRPPAALTPVRASDATAEPAPRRAATPPRAAPARTAPVASARTAVAQPAMPERDTAAQSDAAVAPRESNVAKTVVSPVTSGSSSVNPFTGKALNFEQAQRQLELLRLQSQVLEEQLRQVGLTEDMKNVPLRKAVEAATAATALRKEANVQQQLEQAAQAAARSEAEARANARAAKQQVSRAAKPAQPARSEPVVAAPPPIRLVSVLNVAGQRAAVFTVGDASMIVRQGEQSPFGLVDIAGANAVRLGTQHYAVDAHTLARAVLPDRAVEKTPSVNQSGAPRPTNPAQPSNAGLPPAPPAAASAPSSPALPPLQLPPGVRLLSR